MIRLNNVGCGYPKGFKFKNINLDIGKGEFLGIIGPNGSGKTTVLKTMAGIIKPFSGSVEINGRKISEIDIFQRGQLISYVPSETLFDFPFTVEQVVIMGRNPYLGRFKKETDRDMEIARWAIEITGCEDIINRKINSLSSGEKQKVLLSRAICQQSEVMLLDEPSSHLDINHIKEVFSLLKKLVSEGLTVVCVLHDLNLAMSYCDNIAAIKKGEIKFKGNPKKIVKEKVIEKIYGKDIEITDIKGRPFIIL
ncbi:MAG: ABC transporter ATP-binding protein [Elusimicrobiota bacterium]